MTIVENILERDADAESRVLPFGAGNLKVEKVLPCDVSFDTMADVDEKTRNDRRYAKHGDYSIQGMMKGVAATATRSTSSSTASPSARRSRTRPSTPAARRT